MNSVEHANGYSEKVDDLAHTSRSSGSHPCRKLTKEVMGQKCQYFYVTPLTAKRDFFPILFCKKKKGKKNCYKNRYSKEVFLLLGGSDGKVVPIPQSPTNYHNNLVH